MLVLVRKALSFRSPKVARLCDELGRRAGSPGHEVYASLTSRGARFYDDEAGVVIDGLKVNSTAGKTGRKGKS